MLNDLIKWCLRTTIVAVFWVFVFSINWRDRSLFYHANDVLVQNQLVQALDEQLGDIWDRLSETARLTFSDPTTAKEKI